MRPHAAAASHARAQRLRGDSGASAGADREGGREGGVSRDVQGVAGGVRGDRQVHVLGVSRRDRRFHDRHLGHHASYEDNKL